MRVEVVPYDAQWPADFDLIKRSLERALAGVPYISIEHVGSTAVPGLCAKPIIDISIVVPSAADVQPAAAALAATPDAAYVCFGELGIPGRHVMLDRDSRPRRNVYVCVDGCVALRNHLGVREVLRRDEDLREEYACVKRGLAQREMRDVAEYTEAKSEVLLKILARTGLSEEEMAGIRRSNLRSNIQRAKEGLRDAGLGFASEGS